MYKKLALCNFGEYKKTTVVNGRVVVEYLKIKDLVDPEKLSTDQKQVDKKIDVI